MGELFHLQEKSSFNENYKEAMNLKIESATYVAPLSVQLHFNDGAVQTVDVGAFIKKHPHPQYNAYLDERKFKKFRLEMGNIVWGKNWDLIFPLAALREGTCE